jgi:hypothetical protein
MQGDEDFTMTDDDCRALHIEMTARMSLRMKVMERDRIERKKHPRKMEMAADIIAEFHSIGQTYCSLPSTKKLASLPGDILFKILEILTISRHEKMRITRNSDALNAYNSELVLKLQRELRDVRKKLCKCVDSPARTYWPATTGYKMVAF